MLLFQISANVLYAVQYVFLDAWPAFAVSIVSALECVVVYYYANRMSTKATEKAAIKSDSNVGRATDNTAKMPLPILILIMILTTVFGLMDYTDALSLLPVVVTIAYSWAVWQPNLRIFRIIAALIPVCWLIYNMHVGAWVSMCTAVVEFGSAAAAIVRIDIMGKSTRKHGKI